jgi:hypothetical protein
MPNGFGAMPNVNEKAGAMLDKINQTGITRRHGVPTRSTSTEVVIGGHTFDDWGSVVLPRISGGSGEGEGDGDGGDPASGNNDTGGGNDDELGEGGLKALDSERAARARADKAATTAAKERDDALAKLKEIEEQNKTASEKERDKAVKEAEERVRKETLATANQKLVRASVRAAAAGKLANPEDAVRFLDMADIKVDDDGEVDDKQVTSAIDDLLKEKPYLAGKTKPGKVDQGARQSGADDENLRGTSRMAKAYAESSKKS